MFGVGNDYESFCAAWRLSLSRLGGTEKKGISCATMPVLVMQSREDAKSSKYCRSERFSRPPSWAAVGSLLARVGRRKRAKSRADFDALRSLFGATCGDSRHN